LYSNVGIIANIYLYNYDSYNIHINKSDIEDITVLNCLIVRDTIYLITKDKDSKLYFTFSSYSEKNKDKDCVKQFYFIAIYHLFSNDC